MQEETLAYNSKLCQLVFSSFSGQGYESQPEGQLSMIPLNIGRQWTRLRTSSSLIRAQRRGPTFDFGSRPHSVSCWGGGEGGTTLPQCWMRCCFRWLIRVCSGHVEEHDSLIITVNLWVFVVVETLGCGGWWPPPPTPHHSLWLVGGYRLRRTAEILSIVLMCWDKF